MTHLRQQLAEKDHEIELFEGEPVEMAHLDCTDIPSTLCRVCDVARNTTFNVECGTIRIHLNQGLLEGDCQNQPQTVNMDNANMTSLIKEGQCDDVLVTNQNGLVIFKGVPHGIKFRVKVLNAPANAIRTIQQKGVPKHKDSDLDLNGWSDAFDLSNFGASSTFDEIDLDYILPQVRVWDDMNQNGIQDISEIGIRGVYLRLIHASYGSPIVMESIQALQELWTNDDGRWTRRLYARFHWRSFTCPTLGRSFRCHLHRHQ